MAAPTSPAFGGGCAPWPTGPTGTPSAGRSPFERSSRSDLDGRSTRQLPYERRRELLIELGFDGGVRWRTPRHVVADSERVLAATREHGLAGVVAKRLGSPYLTGARNGAWVEHKHRRTEPFLVSGWSPPEHRCPESLLL